MDLSGRTPAYRGGATRCPACGDVMHPELTPSAELEVCDACEGLWIDWFDGDVGALAAEHEAVRAARGSPLPARSSQPPTGACACPRCARPLVAELYRFADATERDLITGVELLRCPECAGSFVPRGSAHLLLDRSREERTQGPLEALLALVRQLLGRNRTER